MILLLLLFKLNIDIKLNIQYHREKNNKYLRGFCFALKKKRLEQYKQ